MICFWEERWFCLPLFGGELRMGTFAHISADVRNILDSFQLQIRGSGIFFLQRD